MSNSSHFTAASASPLLATFAASARPLRLRARYQIGPAAPLDELDELELVVAAGRVVSPADPERVVPLLEALVSCTRGEIWVTPAEPPRFPLDIYPELATTLRAAKERIAKRAQSPLDEVAADTEIDPVAAFPTVDAGSEPVAAPPPPSSAIVSATVDATSDGRAVPRPQRFRDSNPLFSRPARGGDSGTVPEAMIAPTVTARMRARGGRMGPVVPDDLEHHATSSADRLSFIFFASALVILVLVVILIVQR